ncbi:hypothetical protein A9K55_002601 [Cordyceps militaris]|uniref:Uncharacterized protein n=1 Tax=Cordyceps militaris TaxID=73501 RepID=A0A2H4S6J0_CORMI|nr:hypothetical protein A9K55_002601 [Cordyceps militaris]
MSADEMNGSPPPSYQDVVDEKASDRIPPSLLSVDGQTITTQHHEGVSPTAAYRLNRGIATLSHATSEVTFERVVKAHGQATEKAPDRTRHIYNLRYIHKAPGGLEGVPSDSPHYYVESVSSKTGLGSLGMKKSTLRKHWKALPLDLSGKTSSYKLPQFVKDADAVFTLSLQGDQFVWADARGNVVAEEIPQEDGSASKLQVKSSLQRDSFEMLVALWCCHVWQQSAEGQPRVQTRLESVRHKLSLSKDLPSRGNQFMRF